MRSISRLMATIAVAALSVTLPVPAQSASATAATRPQGFQPPTTVRYLGAECTEIDEYTWEVTYKWAVRGGRYANLGNPQYKESDDLVRFGGRRVIRSTATLTGFGDLDVEQPEVDAWYIHDFAPIRKRDDVMTWRNTTRTQTINLDCG